MHKSNSNLFSPFKNKSWHFYALSIVLLVAIGLRFYHFPYRYSLGEETVRDAVIGIQGARDLQFPLTGAFSSLGPFTFGPWYAYQVIAFSLLFPFNYSPWIYLGIISVLYVFIIYKIGLFLGGKTFGVILAMLAAISPAQVISATHLTSHNNTNLFAVLALFIFLKIAIKNVSYWWGFFLGFVIGVGMNLHFQMSGLLILPLVLLFYKRMRYLYFVTACVGVIVAFFPMIIFESNNHWFNTKNIIDYLLYGKNRIYVPNRWLFYIRDFWPSFWGDVLGTPILVTYGFILGFIIAIIDSVVRKKLSILIILLLIVFLFNFVALRYYWGPRFFGYLNFLRPFVFIFTAYAIFQVLRLRYGKVFMTMLLVILIVFALQKTKELLIRDPFAMRMHDEITQLKKLYPHENFTVFGCSSKYRGNYNSIVYSEAFLLDADKKQSDTGTKIGIESSDCPHPEIINKSSAVVIVPQTSIIVFKNIDEKRLQIMGWKKVNFRTIYDSYARWWFELQP